MVSIETINLSFYYLHFINITFSERVIVEHIIPRNVACTTSIMPQLIITCEG